MHGLRSVDATVLNPTDAEWAEQMIRQFPSGVATLFTVRDPNASDVESSIACYNEIHNTFGDAYRVFGMLRTIRLGNRALLG